MSETHFTMSEAQANIFCDGPAPLKFYLLVAERELQRKIERNGGRVVSDIEDSIAIIIPSLFSSNAVEKLLSKKSDRAIILAQWVHECDEQGRRINFQDFECVVDVDSQSPLDDITQDHGPALVTPKIGQAEALHIDNRGSTIDNLAIAPRFVQYYTDDENEAMAQHLSHGPPSVKVSKAVWVPFQKKHPHRTLMALTARHGRRFAALEQRADIIRRERATADAQLRAIQHAPEEHSQPSSSESGTINNDQHSVRGGKLEGTRSNTLSVVSGKRPIEAREDSDSDSVSSASKRPRIEGRTFLKLGFDIDSE